MSTTDVHRLIDNWLPNKKCSGVTLAHVYTATIDGQEIAGQFDPSATVDDVAQFLCSLAKGGETDNAQVEGHEVHEPPPELEHEPPAPEHEAEVEPEEESEDDHPHKARRKRR
jgi:hypothetical protein